MKSGPVCVGLSSLYTARSLSGEAPRRQQVPGRRMADAGPGSISWEICWIPEGVGGRETVGCLAEWVDLDGIWADGSR